MWGFALQPRLAQPMPRVPERGGWWVSLDRDAAISAPLLSRLRRCRRQDRANRAARVIKLGSHPTGSNESTPRFQT